MPFTYAKGSPEALEFGRKMAALKAEKAQRLEQQARATLGANASAEQIEAWKKDSARAERQARAADRERKRQQEIAAENNARIAAAASSAAPPLPGAGTGQVTQPSPATGPAFETQAEATASLLYTDPVFGGFKHPDGMSHVELHRLPSERPEHRSVAPGYLEDIPFAEFNKNRVRALHGGGKFRVIAIDVANRFVRQAEFEISGKAKPFSPDDSDETLGGRIGSAVRGDRPEDAARMFYEQDRDRKLDRLEALVENLLVARDQTPQKPAETEESRLAIMQKQFELREAADEAKHNRRMAELKAELAAKAAEDDRKLAATTAAANAASAQQSELMKTLFTSQQSLNQTLLTAMVSGKKDDGGTTAIISLIGPLLANQVASAKQQSDSQLQMMEIVRDMASGEDTRTGWQRALDTVEKGAAALFNKGGDTLITEAIKLLGRPKNVEEPLNFVPGSAFQLPDGRVVPPEICGQFLQRYVQIYGVQPSMNAWITGLTGHMNALATQPQGQQQPQQAQGQPQSPQGAPQAQQGFVSPQQAQQHQQVLFYANLTQPQAEEILQKETQKAAEQATREGKTPEQAAEIARQTAASVMATIQQNVTYARAVLAGKAPPPGQPQAAQQPQAAPQAPLVQPNAAPPPAVAPPPPAPAAVAAVAGVRPAVPEPAPAAVAAATSNNAQAAAQAASAAATVAAKSSTFVAGPIPPPAGGSATLLAPVGPILPAGVAAAPAWIYQHIAQDMVIAFKSRVDPIDFLEGCLKTGKISEDAKKAIGDVYSKAGKNEALSAILTKIGMMLYSRGIQIPPEMQAAFRETDGEPWLESFLYACACDTIEEARKDEEEDEEDK